jgi:AcrR family transcriptional regulator
MATTTGVDERRTNTREQIRVVAMEMFAEQGYDKTSLREIAERLGVTKAAVYYHFRTKEEIVTTLFDDQLAGIDSVLTWAEEQPPGVERARAVLERYSRMLANSTVTPNLMKFLQENQTSFRGLASGEAMRERFTRLGGLLTPADASIAQTLKTRLALFAIHFGSFGHNELPGTREERFAAALEVALGLVDEASG